MADVTDAMVEAGAKAGAVTRFEARRILTAALSAGPKSEVELETTAEERKRWQGYPEHLLDRNELFALRASRDIDRLLGLPLPPAHGGK